MTDDGPAAKHNTQHLQMRAAAFDASSSLWLLIDAEGRVLDANATLCRVIGMTADGLVGRFCWEIQALSARDECTHWLRTRMAALRTDEHPAGKIVASPADASAVQPLVRELRLLDGDGVEHTFELSVRRPLKQNTTWFMIEGRDVTERARRETALAERERQQRLLTDNMHELLFLMRVDPDGVLRCESVNPAYVRTTGMSEDWLLGKSANEVLPPASAAHALARYAQVLRERTPLTYREDVPLANGRLIVETRLTPLINAEGTITHLLGLARDVTAEVRATSAVTDAEARFRAVLDAGFDAFVITRAERDPAGAIVDFLIVDANSSASELASMPVSAMHGMSLLTAFPHSRDTSLLEQCVQVVETGRPFDITQFAPLPGKQSRWVLRQLVPVNDGVAIWSRDITDRTVERLALEASEARHRELFEGNGAIQLLAEVDSARILDVNPAAQQFYGWPRETMQTMLATELDGTTMADWRATSTAIALGTGGARVQVREHRVANQGRRQVDTFISVVPIDGRQVVHLIVQDVSDRTRAREQLRESEALLRTVFSGMGEGVAIHDTTGAIVECNPSAERILGLSLAQLRGEQPLGDIWEATHEDGTPWPQATHPAFRALATGERQARAVMAIRQGQGDRRWITVTAAPLLRPNEFVPYGAVAVFSDITHERALDERQRQSQTLDAVGQLAGGIAHDFNNLLTVIRGATGFLSETLGNDPIHGDDLRSIARATDRAEGLTRRLLAVGRRQLLQRARVDLNALLRDHAVLARLAAPTSITVHVVLANGSVVALLDRPRLVDALRVLIDNAIDAMPTGGAITFRTDVVRRARNDAHEINGLAAQTLTPTSRERRYAVIAVEDTGVGMPDEIKARLFEPFFSTQQFGAGRGMDLASVHGMVAQSGGFIECESEPGRGTVLRLLFPESSALPAVRPTPRSMPMPARGRHVLVVDDDPMLRELARRTLEKLNYDVTIADSGPEALHIIEQTMDVLPSGAAAQSGAPVGDIDLLLTDLTMPGMDGMELIDAVLLARPGFPIVAISGFALDSTVRDALAARQVPFVAKPFSNDALPNALALALQQSPRVT